MVMNPSDVWPNKTNDNSSSPTQGLGGFSPQYYAEPMGLKVSKLAIQIAIALVGVVGNLLVCVVITKRAHMKTAMNLYLRNLAIADLGVLLVNFPITVIDEFGIAYPFGKHVCLYIAPATDIFFGACIWSITVIAIERHKNIISRRAFAKRPESFKKVTLKILLIWLISFLVVAVPMYPIMFYDEVHRQCYPDWPDLHGNNLMFVTYTVGLTIFWYLLPLGIITYTYVKISRRVVQSNQFHKEMHGDDFSKSQLIRKEEKQRLKSNKKAQRILTPLVAVFAISMLPLTIFRLAMVFHPAFLFHEFFYFLFSVCALFVVVNSAADPIVYYISSKEFRKVLETWLCKRENSPGESSVLGKTACADSLASNTINTCTVVQTSM